MTWFRIELTRERVLQGEYDHLRRRFMQRWHDLSRPEAAILLSSWDVEDPEQDIPAVVYYYLSPAAVHMFQDLLSAFGARYWSEPPPDHRVFIAGDEDYLSGLQLAATSEVGSSDK